MGHWLYVLLNLGAGLASTVSSASDCRFLGPELKPQLSHIAFMVIDHEIIYRSILSLQLIHDVDRAKRIWYLSPMQAAKVQASLRIRAVSPEPSLLAHTSSESRGTFRQKARSLAPLNGWACAVEICHDGMLRDTNSLDGAHLISGSMCTLVLVNHLWGLSLPMSSVSKLTDHCYMIEILLLWRKTKWTNQLSWGECILFTIVLIKHFPSIVSADISQQIVHVHWTSLSLQMNHIMRKPVFAICEQQRWRSACASTQSDQCLCCSLSREYNTYRY